MYKLDLRDTLCIVTDRSFKRDQDYLSTLEAALDGGATMVQLREKSSASGRAVTDRAFFEEGLVLRELCRRRGVLFIVDDRLDMAMALDADGIHLGQQDLPVLAARKIWPAGGLFGVSALTLEEALRAESEGADYIGAGAVFATSTKPGAGESGLSELTRIVRGVGVPVIAIGGIGPLQAGPVMSAGCAGIAVVSSVWSSATPREATVALRTAMREGRE